MMIETWNVLLYVMGALVGLAGFLVVYLRRKYRGGLRWCTSQASMRGKVVIITGASAGIGKETARDLARRGAHVIMACRNLQKAGKVAEEIRKDTGNDLVEVHLLDTSSMASVRNFANNFLKNKNRLDVLILNAGILGPSKLTFTDRAHELTLATNHLGHFLLTNILLDLLKKSSPSRIIVVSSGSHHNVYGFDIDDLNNRNRPYVGSFQVYCYSKLCNILFVKQLSQYLEGTDVACNVLCPGLVNTEILHKTDGAGWLTYFRLISKFASQTEVEGAQCIIHLAVAEEEARTRGEFFYMCKITESSPLSCDMGQAKKLWEKSEDLVDLKPEEKHY